MKSSELKQGAVYLGYPNSKSEHLQFPGGTPRRKWRLRRIERIIPADCGDGGWIVFTEWNFPWCKAPGYDLDKKETADIYAQVPVPYSFPARGLKIVNTRCFATWAREEVTDIEIDFDKSIMKSWVAKSMPMCQDFEILIDGESFGEDIKEMIAEMGLK